MKSGGMLERFVSWCFPFSLTPSKRLELEQKDRELDRLEALMDEVLEIRRRQHEYDQKWIHCLHWAIRDKVGTEGWREILDTATKMADDPKVTPKQQGE